MKNIITYSAALFSAMYICNIYAQGSTPLEGYGYGISVAPQGNEWESPENLSLNKEQPHAYFFDFANVEEARNVLPSNSTYWSDLNGTWKFNWVPEPSQRPVDFYRTDYNVDNWDDLTVPGCWNIQGIQKDGSLKYGLPIYTNQKVIFHHKVEPGDWKGGVMREPNPEWTTYQYRNEVGSYRRDFSIPAGWEGKEIYLNFDGVNSFFYLWINGKYVGFSKNSRTTASFDITQYLNAKGSNTVAVEVYRNSDGSFLESQDMWRLPGIYRSVYLSAKNKVQVKDVIIRTNTIDNGKGEAVVKVENQLNNLTTKDAKGLHIIYNVYSCELWKDENEPVNGLQNINVPISDITKLGGAYVSTEITVPQPKLWSSEAPNRYILVGQLQDKKGKTLETFSSYFGIRKVEIKETPASEDEFGLAGRYYYINGKTVKLKGVNRHEMCLETGNTLSHEQIEDEIMLMRRGNINHVRTSHYANDPYWFYACDKYGIYLEDEANIESHEYYYGAASLSHVPEFRAAHIARVMESAHAHINAPSIVIWSLGNEAGPGDNFKAAYKALHEFDSSRPVQYERNNNIVDMGSNQYPSIEWTREAVKGKLDLVYPFHISEYAHSMGNAVGDLPQYWEAIESTNFFCGGAIWDWVDQAIWYYDKKTGARYMAYGGDFGDKPNDGMFCMNGILFPDHTPKPAYYEVKKVYQYVGVKMLDAQKGRIEVFNKNYFTPMKDLQMVWSLWKDGQQVGGLHYDFGGPKIILGPRERQEYTIPYDLKSLDPNSEYFVRVQFLLAKDMPWAEQGYVQAEEQFALPFIKNYQAIAATGAINVATEQDMVNVTGENFKATFSNIDGSLSSLTYGSQSIFTTGNGPKINCFRSPVDNDNWGGARSSWAANGLQAMEHKAQGAPIITRRQDGAVEISYDVVCSSPRTYAYNGGASGRNSFEDKGEMPADGFKIFASQIWTVYPDGSIELESGTTSNKPETDLARMGYVMKLDKSIDQYKYYGRGPKNNYNDRCTGSFIGLYSSTVADLFEPFPKPQDMANREGVRWCSLTDKSGHGVQFIAADVMSASALPWNDMQLTMAPHPYELPISDGNYLNIDSKVTGLGGNSCGQGGPLKEDCTKAIGRTFGFIIRPVSDASDASLIKSAKVKMTGSMPINIERDRLGMLKISSEDTTSEILYTIIPNKPLSKKQLKAIKPQIYTGQIEMRNAATVSAWYKGQEARKVSKTYDKIEIVPLTVIYASSQEPDYGEATNLVDGDPESVWFTAYGVTVAQYPHWVDFDALETKLIKGFSYLPILDSTSGNIKRYEIYVSQDGKDWGEPIISSEFTKSNSEQKVLFPAPVSARYIRLKGLDSQNGRDYAGGSEFNILVEE